MTLPQQIKNALGEVFWIYEINYDVRAYILSHIEVPLLDQLTQNTMTAANVSLKDVISRSMIVVTPDFNENMNMASRYDTQKFHRHEKYQIEFLFYVNGFENLNTFFIRYGKYIKAMRIDFSNLHGHMLSLRKTVVMDFVKRHECNITVLEISGDDETDILNDNMKFKKCHYLYISGIGINNFNKTFENLKEFHFFYPEEPLNENAFKDFGGLKVFRMENRIESTGMSVIEEKQIRDVISRSKHTLQDLMITQISEENPFFGVLEGCIHLTHFEVVAGLNILNHSGQVYNLSSITHLYLYIDDPSHINRTIFITPNLHVLTVVSEYEVPDDGSMPNMFKLFNEIKVIKKLILFAVNTKTGLENIIKYTRTVIILELSIDRDISPSEIVGALAGYNSTTPLQAIVIYDVVLTECNEVMNLVDSTLNIHNDFRWKRVNHNRDLVLEIQKNIKTEQTKSPKVGSSKVGSPKVSSPKVQTT